MTSPPTDRSLASLHPIFRAPLEAWLAHVARVVPHVEMRVTETRRTKARQAWLYAQGRQEPFLNAPRVTWTMDSRHRWGLAADLAMIRKDGGAAIWEVSSWRWLYQTVPPELYGLKHLAPTEWLHLEHRWSDEAITEAALLGLTRS
jgi:hypothetical protein